MTVSGEIFVRTAGLTPGRKEQIYTAHAKKQLVKLSRGIYIPKDTFADLPPWDRYHLRCLAVSETHPGHVLAGKSAASVWGMPFGPAPERITVAGINAPGRSPSPDLDHRRLARGTRLWIKDGVRLTSPVHTALDIARWHDLADAVAAADHVLAKKWATLQTFEESAQQLKGHKGVAATRDLLHLAHPASESPRESALRTAVWRAGLPLPHVQADLRDSGGRWLGRADLFFDRHSVILEYDGESKYQGAYGQPFEQVSREEHDRKKALLNAGLRIIRVTAGTFRDGTWLRDLERELHHGLGRPFPGDQWSSQGWAWGPAEQKCLHAGAFRI